MERHGCEITDSSSSGDQLESVNDQPCNICLTVWPTVTINQMSELSCLDGVKMESVVRYICQISWVLQVFLTFFTGWCLIYTLHRHNKILDKYINYLNNQLLKFSLISHVFHISLKKIWQIKNNIIIEAHLLIILFVIEAHVLALCLRRIGWVKCHMPRSHQSRKHVTSLL